MIRVNDRLSKVNDTLTVTTCDNGYVLEVSGENYQNNYATVKLVVHDADDLLELIKSTVDMERV